jgi:hypothetical protein
MTKPLAASPPRPFVILALPRSRTAWLAYFLTYGGWLCGHEQLRYMRSMDDVRSWLAMPQTGTVETALAPFWRLIPQAIQIVTVRRDPAAVVRSAVAQGFSASAVEWTTRRLARKLDQLEARRPDVLRIEYDELTDESVVRRLWAATVGLPFDLEWFTRLSPLNIQYSMALMFRYVAAHERQLAEFAYEGRLAAMPRRPWARPLFAARHTRPVHHGLRESV